MRRRMNLASCGALSVVVMAACGDDKGGTTGEVTPDVTAEVTPDGVEPGETSEPGDTGAPPDTAPEPEVVAPTEADTLLLLDEEGQMVFGLSGIFEIDVPADVVSITISLMGDPAMYYALGDWVGPDGYELVTPGWSNTDEGQQGMCMSCRNRIVLSGGDFATVAPNNPEAAVTPGRYTFSFWGYEPPEVIQSQGPCNDGVCHVTNQFQCPSDCGSDPARGPIRVLVHAKTAAGGLPATGVLDMNLHFTGAEGLTAETAQSDGDFQAALQSMRDIYAQAGVTIGTLTYIDIDPSYRSIESIDGATSDLQQMFALSAGNPEAVNLFFVEDLSAGAFGGFGVLLGIAGGIPGPIVQGSSRSGVAIAVKPVQGMPAGVDTTMAHEVGHFLGLFHTSEQAFFGPQLHDPLPDTPQNDETYLMFNTGAGDQLSPYQGQVMRSSPWVRHPAAP